MFEISNWIIIDRGSVPKRAIKKEYTCMTCGEESLLPMVGSPIAQIGQGIVFDIGTYSMPKTIRCPHCRHVLEMDEK